VRQYTTSLLLPAMMAASVAFAQEAIGPAPITASSQRPTATANGYIVVFAQGTSPNLRANVVVATGAGLRHNYIGTDAAAVTVPSANVLEALRRSADVVRVVPDFIIHNQAKGGKGGPPPTTVTFDTRQVIPLGVQRVGPPATGSDGAGIGIAVVDSGIDFAHPDLDPAPDTPATAFNAISPGASCQDDGGHGTHISGIIAALNNSIGVVGVASAATLYCVKVLGSDLTGTDSNLLAGLDWVLQHHASVNPPIRVVNLSLGRPLDTEETLSTSVFRPEIQSLYNLGIVVVASAGNDPTAEITQFVPAGFPEVLAVASTVATNGIRTCLLSGLDIAPIPADAASVFTTDGADVTISAPGEEWTDIINLSVLGCQGLQYGTLSTTLGTAGATRKLVPSVVEARGTSFSAPLVTGTVARVMQKLLVPLDSGAATVEGVRSWLQTNASRVGVAPVDNPLGGTIYPYSFDGFREGIAQAPK
jgi:subtilisin family serine protease